MGVAAVGRDEIVALAERAGEEAAPERANRGRAPMPSSRSVGRISASTSRVHSEYSVSIAVSGWVLWARRMVFGPASHRPRWRTLPCSTSRAMAPTVSSIGTVGSMRWM